MLKLIVIIGLKAAIMNVASYSNQESMTFDASVNTGFSLRQDSTGDGVSAYFGYGLNMGLNYRLIKKLHLRCEFLALSDTFSGGDDVEAIRFKRWQLNLGLMFGVNYTFLKRGKTRIGIIGLLGPGLRLSNIDIDIYDQKNSLWAKEPMIIFGLEPYLRYSFLRLGFRMMTEAIPRRPFRALLVLGVQF